MRQKATCVLCAVACALMLMPGCGCGKRPPPPPPPPPGVAPPKDKIFVVDPNATLVAALSGALSGGHVEEFRWRLDRGPAETRQSAQGVLLELRSVNADPATVGPAGQVALDATYALVPPDDQQRLEVTQTRLVTLDGTKVAEIRASTNRGTGTCTDRVPITLPSTAARGKYDLLITISAGGASSQLRSSFTVH